MLNSVILSIVDFCARHCRPVIVLGTLLMVATAGFDHQRFSITTDVEELISRSLPWHRRQLAFADAFPQNGIAAVVTAPTAENAEQATDQLARYLARNPGLFPAVVQPDSGAFFEQNGLLFDNVADVRKSIDGLSKAQFLISELAGDPTLRGALKALSFAAQGVEGGQVTIDQLGLAALARRQNTQRRAVRQACDIFLAGIDTWTANAVQPNPAFRRDQSSAGFWRVAARRSSHCGNTTSGG